MDKIIVSLIQMEQQLRIFHWQTKSFARHTAFGAAYSSLGDLIDRFAEVCMGKHGRFELEQSCTLDLLNIQEVRPDEFLNATAEMLMGITASFDSKRDSDLINIRDEMLAEINKLKYLLTLQ
jgi:DNA-binding ferritin-like protein